MKYLFLLLVLAACGQKTEKQKAEAIKAEAMASADAVVAEMNDRDIEKTMPKDSRGGLIDYDREDGVVPFPKTTISNYLNKANPYRKEYEKFFQDQLEFQGEYSEHDLFVNQLDLIDLNIKLGFSLAPDPKSPDKTLICIFTNNKTNYYPME